MRSPGRGPVRLKARRDHTSERRVRRLRERAKRDGDLGVEILGETLELGRDTEQKRSVQLCGRPATTGLRTAEGGVSLQELVEKGSPLRSPRRQRR